MSFWLQLTRIGDSYLHTDQPMCHLLFCDFVILVSITLALCSVRYELLGKVIDTAHYSFFFKVINSVSDYSLPQSQLVSIHQNLFGYYSPQTS